MNNARQKVIYIVLFSYFSAIFTCQRANQLRKSWNNVGKGIDRRACACLDTSGVASLRQTSTRPAAKLKCLNSENRKPDGCGFRAEPLAKTPHLPSAIFSIFKPHSNDVLDVSCRFVVA